MTLDEAIRTRRSIRRYTGAPLTDEQLKSLMEAAMTTPSACDCRPWEFVVVRDRERLARLAACGQYTGMAKDAGAVIVICATPDRQAICPGFFPQDCGAVAMNIWLQATALGLGAVWCGVYPGEEMMGKVAAIVETPDHVLPFGLICVGEPAEHPAPRDRYEASRIHEEIW